MNEHLSKTKAARLFKFGGNYIGEVRSWIQRRKFNGSDVTWGSMDELRPPMRVDEAEEIAAIAAAAAINEYESDLEKRHERLLVTLQDTLDYFNAEGNDDVPDKFGVVWNLQQALKANSTEDDV